MKFIAIGISHFTFVSSMSVTLEMNYLMFWNIVLIKCSMKIRFSSPKVFRIEFLGCLLRCASHRWLFLWALSLLSERIHKSHYNLKKKRNAQRKGQKQWKQSPCAVVYLSVIYIILKSSSDIFVMLCMCRLVLSWLFKNYMCLFPLWASLSWICAHISVGFYQRESRGWL